MTGKLTAFNFAEGDAVVLTEDYPNLGLSAGAVGIVWVMYATTPPCYEVTWQDKDGRDFDMTMDEEELAEPTNFISYRKANPMPDETSALLEIASLLRRRVEQHDEMAKRSQETQERFEQQRSSQETVEQVRQRGEQRAAEMTTKMERRTEEVKQERDRLQHEQRQFQENLLAEIKRHNDLMERLLSRLV